MKKSPNSRIGILVIGAMILAIIGAAVSRGEARLVHAQQNITFSASVNRTAISLDDRLTLSIQVSRGEARLAPTTNFPEPRLPAMDGFVIVGSSRSQSISIVNGVTSASVNFKYTLQPRQVGKLTIGAASITIDGQTYTTDPIAVTVTEGAAPMPPTAQMAAPAEGASPQLRGQDLFVETVTDEKRAYLGEQVTLIFRFYQAVNLFNSPRYDPPTTGFWSEGMPPQKQYYQNVAGRRYLVTELYTALFGTEVGAQTISPAILTIPGDFFSRDYKLKTQPLTVEILPLPEENKPPDFSGVVGQFSVTARLDTPEVAVNNPVHLIFTIRGQGNIQAIGEPVWPQLADLRAYDAQGTANTNQDNYIIQGEKTYDKLLVPKRAGEYTIPPLSFSYFDPEAGAYRTLKTAPLPLIVSGVEEEPPAAVTGGASAKRDITVVGHDIRHIKTAPAKLRMQEKYLYQDPLFRGALLVPPVVLIGAAILQYNRQRRQQNPSQVRAQRARGVARKRLSAARRALKDENYNNFYGEVTKALVGYLGDKLNVPAAGLSLSAVTQPLTARGVSEEIVTDLRVCWESADMGRFAPGGITRAHTQDLLARTEQVLASLEGVKWS